jgi:hypothetical protein
MDSYIREAYAVDYDNGSDYVHEDEASFCEVHKCYATGDYYSRDNLVYCEDIGDYVHTEEEYAWVEDVDEYYHKTDDLIICEYDGTYWLDKDNYIEHMEKLLKDR